VKVQNKNILIVDDFEDMRRIIMENLQSQGYEIFFLAANGLEALSICQENEIDLIISDWHMPMVDGLALLEKIREQGRTRHIPFIFITSGTNSLQVNQAIASGVNEFVVKPFTANTLFQKLS